ncbi:MAG: hypothetical protein SGI90_16755 [Candidatus Eisenbacteria bacterium]|nr:hypothetical protein [Candidatus Eisenbacteria bacterium]
MNPGGGIQDGSFSMTSSELIRLDPSADCDAPSMSVPCECSADFPTLNYRYTAWDESGAIVATGCASLTFTAVPGFDPPEYEVVGNRCVAVRCVENAGSAHQGSSPVAGRLEANGQLFLDLNAGTADRNIYLQATGMLAFGGYLSGTWGESTLIGVVGLGTFLLDRTSQ